MGDGGTPGRGAIGLTMDLNFRDARQSDLTLLVDMLADDELGAQREDSSKPLNQAYLLAFSSIESDPNNQLVVVEGDDKLVGMLQLTFIPYLSHRGSWRCLIESVRIQSQFRGMGLGTELFEWAIKRARQKGCRLVQLTSDKKRPEAIRFYENLGFQASHEGFKLRLE
jgi:ribosomal protein S18 acetylase RimI-like enzyme